MTIRDNHTTEGSARVVHKFGRNFAVGTTFVPVTIGGVYRMPQVAAATKLRIKAGNTNDTVAGSGARTVLIQGTLIDGSEATEILSTAGIAASADSTNDYIRLYRAYVVESGTYGDGLTSKSHADDIVIENAAGTADWMTIDSTDFSRGQSEVALYPIPTGSIGYIKYNKVNTDALKSTTVILVQRQGILDTAAPYHAFRLIGQLGGIAGSQTLEPDVAYGPYPAGTDLGFFAKVSTGTGEVDIDYEIFLTDA